MAGPGIRYWNIARELSKTVDITLLCPNDCDLQSDFSIRKLNQVSLKEELKVANSVILQGVTLWQFPMIKKANIPIIVDLYDPFLFENFEIDKKSINANQLHLSTLTIIVDQLITGDFFICASEKQRDFWLGMLAALNRINADEYRISPDFENLITVVPFGMPDDSPSHNSHVIKGVYPGIKENDKVVIWGGGVWDWLDPITAIYAMELIKTKRDDVKLFFMGVKHPNKDLPISNMASTCMKLSDDLNLTNKYVFFNDWAEYKHRHNYLLEADVGLSLHTNHIETRFAFRTRILDYIWCELPVISNFGDVMSEYIERYKIGEIVISESPEVLANAILNMIDKKKQYTKNFKELKQTFTWSECVKPIIHFCTEPRFSVSKSHVLKLNGLHDKWTLRYQKLLKYLLKGDFKTLLKKTINLIRNSK